MKKKTTILFALMAATFANSRAFAASIDDYEPVRSGSTIPSTADRSSMTDSAWIGYSDGSVYFTGDTYAQSVNWLRMDKGTNLGLPFDMGFSKTVTAVASADSFDEYIAYVAFHSEKYYSQLYRCTYSRGGITWTDLSSASFTDIEGVSVNPIARGRVYVASSSAVRYSVDFGKTWSDSSAGDPLTPPSGAKISAISASRTNRADWIVVGATNGELWLATDARSGAASWVRLDQGLSANLPDRVVTRVQVDDRLSPPAILAVFGGANSQSTWTSMNGGQTFVPSQNPIVSGGNPKPSVISGSLSPLAGDTSIYGQVIGSGAIRSDDNGQTWFQTSRWSGKNIAVEYKHIDTSDGNQLYPALRVKNLGSVAVALNSLKFQYRFTPDGTASQTFTCDYSPFGCNNIAGTIANGGLLQLVIANTSATVAPGQSSGEIQGRVAKSDWSIYNQSNDYSFVREALTWRQNRHVQLFDAQGTWLFGTFAE